MKKLFILIFILCLLFSLNIFSENESGEKIGKDIKNEKIDSEFLNETPISLINFFMALSFVIGLIFFFTYFFKKITGIKNSGIRGQAVKMSIISNLPLGDKKFLLIVEIQGKHHFIGVTPTTINYMANLDLDVKDIEINKDKDEFRGILDRAKELLSGNKK